MNQEKQPEALPEALKIANTCREARIDVDCPLFQSTALADAEYAICKMHTRIAELEAERVLETARTAEEKQKAASLEEELSLRDSWLAECRDAFSLPAVNTEIDHHFCSAMTGPSEVPAYVVAQAKSLEAQLSAIGAGGVEALRKRDQECGNCFEGKSDLDHTCRKCAGSAISPAQEHATQLAGQGQEPSPPVAVTGPVEWPATCDGLEQEAWEAWARVQRFDMVEHPMHYLFLNERTDAARQGWKGGLVYAVEQMKQRVHVVEAAPAQAHKDEQA